MIRRTQIVPMLLKACPKFQAAWNDHVTYWAGVEAGIYNDTAEFVYFLDRCREEGDLASIQSGLETVEQLLVDGDADTKEVATIGLIETIQNVASHSGSQEVYQRYLGSQSRLAWHQLEKDWIRLMSWKRRNPEANKL